MALLVGVLLGGVSGCKKDSTPAAANQARTVEKNAPEGNIARTDAQSADAILKALVAKYQQAPAYRDRASVRVSYRIEGQQMHDEAPLSVVFERPNRLRLEAYRTLVVSDGQMLHARIDDEMTSNIDGQIVARAAPAKLHLQDIYGDALLADVIGKGLARYPVQLELLLDENPLASALGKEARRRLLSPEAIEGHPCDRIEVASPEGAFVFWIDQKSRLLRRLEYPTKQLEPETDVESEVANLALIVDFHEAQFAAHATSETFAFRTPEDARQVRYFVPPPQPLPTTLFNKQPEPFSFKTLSGEAVNPTSLAGKTVAMLWFNNHPAGQASLTALNKVAEQLAENDQIVCYGICTEPSQTTDLQVENLMRSWRVELPIVRDLAAVGRDVFGVPVWPTLIVLDGQGRVQLFETGHIDPVYEALPGVLEKIATGENLAQQILASYQTELDDYDQALAIASGASESSVVEIPTVQIAPRSKPADHLLSEVWTNGELAAPGNMLYVKDQDAETAKLLVLAGNRTVCELDLAGKLVAQYALDIPRNAGVQHLATETDGEGKRVYLAWANLGQQLFLFDSAWQPLASYPDPKQQHDGIRDCALGDLRGDGELALYVAFWGAAGVHEVSLTGQRNWTNRAAAAPMSVTVGPLNAADQRQLLITTAAGDLLPLNPSGREMPPQTIGSYAVHDLMRSPLSSLETPYCAFSLAADGTSRAIALDRDLVERWSYELPVGAHRNAVRPVASGSLLPSSEGDWVFAGADGSIHLIAADGSASDFFYFGQEITGLAAARAGSDLLLIATDKGVTALRLSKK